MSLYGYRLKVLSITMACLPLAGCLQFRMSSSEADEYFKEEPVKPLIKSYELEGRTINYAEVGSDSLPTIIFLHGAPGGWEAFAHFMKNTDLLGW